MNLTGHAVTIEGELVEEGSGPLVRLTVRDELQRPGESAMLQSLMQLGLLAGELRRLAEVADHESDRDMLLTVADQFSDVAEWLSRTRADMRHNLRGRPDAR